MGVSASACAGGGDLVRRRELADMPYAGGPDVSAGCAAETDFYSGKTIQVLIGFSAGSAMTSMHGRSRATWAAIPGNQGSFHRNIPGAGSLKAVNYLYNVAPRDGTAIAGFAPGVVIEPLLGRSEGTQFDAPKFTWLGSISQEVSVCAFIKAAGIKTWQDMQTQTVRHWRLRRRAESDVFPNVRANCSICS
jgi:tripartite-type tricarboxylate transporter receptor subunit TctC